MATKIRLSRRGRKKAPFYFLVVTDSRKSRDGQFIEKLGTYDPLLDDNDKKTSIKDVERIKYWLSVGAIMTDRAKKVLTPFLQ